MSVQEKVLVLHVKTGYEDRAAHIENMLKEKGITFEYITDGDKTDLTPDILRQYFAGGMQAVTAPTSCAMKHFYAYEHIIQNNLTGALIMEDDMVLYDNFIPVFNKCMEERKHRGLSNILISFEDSNLRFVPRSQRIRGTHLYKGACDRFTGCYYISQECARQIMDYVSRNKSSLPIDGLHNTLMTNHGLQYYWCHPTIATQGTHTGLFQSSISKKSANRQNYRKHTWKLKLCYKKLLYWFR
ncbi:MAG: glycosyltransferase family 25 protein [Prevotella sp.]|nr:glycosyltransferase family 25 protein [Prevotella sp.]